MGTPKFNDVTNIIRMITIYFLQMHMTEVYALQNVEVTKMKLREGVFIKKEKVANKSINKMKKEVQEAAKKTKTWE